MKIAYLMNSYPMTSTTFVRREIQALESLQVAVKRYAIRQWSETLVDERDRVELTRTEYLLTGNVGALILIALREWLLHPWRVSRALGPWFRLIRKARGGFVKHAAYLMQAIYLRRQVSDAGIDHIHVHFGTNATAVALLCRVMGGPGYSFTVHGPDELVDPESLSFRLKIAEAKFVVAISEYCRRRLIELCRDEDRDKIRIVHCGLELPDLTQFRTAPSGNHQLVCVGRLCPQKGQHLIPQAVAALRAEFPRIKVLLIGDGESRARVEMEIERLGAQDLVEILGWQSNRRACEVIADSRALILPSFAEGLPVVIMEAMAIERPIISTYIAGIPELVEPGRTGWLVEAGDVEGLTKVMREALNQPVDALARMGAAARERVLERHDILKEAGKLKTLFEAAVSSA